MATMTEDQRYQGWANYPTWAVNLWLSNDEGLYLAARDLAAWAIQNAPDDSNVSEGIWTAEQTRRFRLADALKDWVADELVRTDEADLSSDLIGHALDQVDWHEIADVWLEDA